VKGSRILFIVVALVAVAAVVFLLLPPDRTPAPAVRPPKHSAKAPAPRAPEPADLGALLGLEGLSDCSRSNALAAVLEQMVRIDPTTFESMRGGPIRVQGHERPLTPTFERTREIEGNADIRSVVADLDLSGRWHGLALTGLRRSFYEESDVGAFQLRFAEPPDRVRDVLTGHGFRLAPVGQVREIDAEGITTSLGIERDGDGAALTCTTG
jgi:hypothetical protein